MLVLSRRSDETIVFPSLGIEISVVRLSNSNVRLGVKAPSNIKVLRGELVDDDQPNPMDLRSKRTEEEKGLRTAKVASSNSRIRKFRDQCKTIKQHVPETMIDDLVCDLQELDEQLGTLLKRGAEPAAHLPTKSALLVDDNQNELRLLSGYLKLKDFNVESTTDGSEAMQYLNGHQIPDVMVLDMNMPKFDGRWTVNMIRANSKFDGLRIFAVSGVDPRECGVEIGPGGVDLWLPKPLNPEELLLEISNLDSHGHRMKSTRLVTESRTRATPK